MCPVQQEIRSDNVDCDLTPEWQLPNGAATVLDVVADFSLGHDTAQCGNDNDLRNQTRIRRDNRNYKEILDISQQFTVLPPYFARIAGLALIKRERGEDDRQANDVGQLRDQRSGQALK